MEFKSEADQINNLPLTEIKRELSNPSSIYNYCPVDNNESSSDDKELYSANNDFRQFYFYIKSNENISDKNIDKKPDNPESPNLNYDTSQIPLAQTISSQSIKEKSVPQIQHSHSVTDVGVINELESLLITGYNTIIEEKANLSRNNSITTQPDDSFDYAWNFEWNARFQHYLDLPETSPQEILNKYGCLYNLSMDFVSKAKAYAKIIISEHLMGEKHMSIQPKKIGGFAGGSKYIVDGILFKLAKDPYIQGNSVTVYGGNLNTQYEFAAKACGHELKGAAAYFHALNQIKATNVRVPMYVSLQFRGFTMTAMPVLPLESLVYGSSDAGKTLHNSNPTINKVMSDAANMLHLAEHPIHDKMIATSGDTEVHVGKDNRAYILDLSRVLPPEAFEETKHLPILGHPNYYRLFRKEFLFFLKKKLFPPLSSDSLSMWGAQESEKFNKKVVEATKILLNEVIPSFTNEILNGTRHFVEPVSEILHRRGINIRHIGLIRSIIINQMVDDLSRRTSICDALLVEIVSRTLKNLLRSCFRHVMYLHEQSEYASKKVTLLFLNFISFTHPNSHSFWNQSTLPGIINRYGSAALTEIEQKKFFEAVKPLLFRVVKHLLFQVGLELSQSCLNSIEKNSFNIHYFQWTMADLLDSEVRVRYSSILDQAKGKLLLTQALDKDISPDSSLRLLYLAEESLSNALSIDPINDEVIVDLIFTRAMKEENTSGNNNKADNLFMTEIKDSLIGFEENKENVIQLNQITLALFHKLTQLWRARRDFGMFCNCSGASSFQVLCECFQILGKYKECQSTFDEIIQFRKRIVNHSFVLLINNLEVPFDDNRESIIETCTTLMLNFDQFSPTYILKLLNLSDVYTFQNVCAKVLSENIFSGVFNLGVHEVLLELGFDSQNAFYSACYSGNETVLRALLKLNVNIDKVNYNGNTGLHIACRSNLSNITQLLIENGASLQIMDGRGNTPLVSAIRMQNIEIVRLLLNKGADPSYFIGDVYTPLIRAVQSDNLELLVCLLEYHPDINQKVKGVVNALHHAISSNNVQMARILLENGAHVDSLGPDGRSALSKACYDGKIECAELLINRGAKLDLEDKFGYTPITSAQIQGNQKIIELLQRHGVKLPEIIEEESDNWWDCFLC